LLTLQALLGQRYGAKELPAMILAADFDRIRTALSNRRGRDLKYAVPLLDSCYELDENSVEPDRVYVLTNRNFGSSLQSVDNPADVSDPSHNVAYFLSLLRLFLEFYYPPNGVVVLLVATVCVPVCLQ